MSGSLRAVVDLRADVTGWIDELRARVEQVERGLAAVRDIVRSYVDDREAERPRSAPPSEPMPVDRWRQIDVRVSTVEGLVSRFERRLLALERQ